MLDSLRPCLTILKIVMKIDKTCSNVLICFTTSTTEIKMKINTVCTRPVVRRPHESNTVSWTYRGPTNPSWSHAWINHGAINETRFDRPDAVPLTGFFQFGSTSLPTVSLDCLTPKTSYIRWNCVVSLCTS